MVTRDADRLYDLPYRADCARKVRRAVWVAAFNGWSFAVCAIFSAVILVVSIPYDGFSWVGLGITVMLSVITYFEFHGRKLLKQLDPSGAAVLGWNQLGLLAVIVAYCGWSIACAFLLPLPEALSQLGELQDIEELLGENFYQNLVMTIYGSIIFLSVIYQGGNAWYYFSRRRSVNDCIAQLNDSAAAGISDPQA